MSNRTGEMEVLEILMNPKMGADDLRIIFKSRNPGIDLVSAMRRLKKCGAIGEEMIAGAPASIYYITDEGRKLLQQYQNELKKTSRLESGGFFTSGFITEDVPLVFPQVPTLDDRDVPPIRTRVLDVSARGIRCGEDIPTPREK